MAVLEEGSRGCVTSKAVSSSPAFFEWERGILREWFRVVAYCPSCQTSLSNAEVNQGYETVEDPSFYYKVKLREEDAYMISVDDNAFYNRYRRNGRSEPQR